MLDAAVGDIVDGDDDVHLRPGDAVELDGKIYVVQSRMTEPKGYVVADPEAIGVDHPISNRNIKDWHRQERLRFVSRSEFGLPIGIRESLRRTMRAFNKVERTEMFRRLRYCQAIDAQGEDFGRSDVSMQPVCDAIAAARNDAGSHDWTTVNQWWKDWARSGRDVRALCPSFRRRGNRERKIEPYMLKAIEKGVQGWLRRGRPKMSTHYSEVVSECKKHHGGDEAVRAILEADREAWLWPSYKTFSIACRSVDRATTLVRRHGPQAARYEMYPVGEGPDVRLPFERVECDFKYLRIFVVDDKTGFPLGTPYLMAAIDCFSGVVAGFDIGFDPPSYVAAARCLKHVISFKDELKSFPTGEDGRPALRNSWPVNGVPRQFVLDNDAAFHAESFTQSAKALGCHLHYVPPATPWNKGKIERFWGTVQTSFVDMFPGNVLRIGQKPGVDYDPAKDAVLTLTQLRLFITKALVDVHHIGIEPGTEQRRIDLWTDAVSRNPPRPVRDRGSLLELVGAYKVRRAERRGIRIFGLRYNSSDLAVWRKGFPKDPMVEVRYDPQDIGELYVIDTESGQAFKVACTRKDYAVGLSEHQHRVIQRRAKEVAGLGRLPMTELILAKAELFDLGMAMLGGKRSRRTNARLAHFLGIGRELLDEAKARREDPEESREHIDIEKEQIDDPDDETKARADEAEMDRTMEEVASTVAPSVSAQAPPAVAPQVPVPPSSAAAAVRRPRTTMKVSYDD